jgi:phosphonate transport system permease protein
LPPPRFQHRSLVEYAALLAVLGAGRHLAGRHRPVAGQRWAAASPGCFAPSGLLTQMFPPDFTRIVPIGWKLLETLQMAVAGCFLGLILAVPFRHPRHRPACRRTR